MSIALPPARFQKFTVPQYHRMIEAGVLSEDHLVELLEGYLVTKMPHNPAHSGTLTRFPRRLARALPENWIIRVQLPITTKDSEPEPDIAVVSGPEEKYLTRQPVSWEIGLVVETANTSLEEDRLIKGRVYARARIAVYWIANLVDRQIEVYTQPRGGRNPSYQRRQDFGLKEIIPLILHFKARKWPGFPYGSYCPDSKKRTADCSVGGPSA